MARMLYIVRHAQPDFGQRGPRCIGRRTDLPLSGRGVRQARDLSEFFADKNISCVYHSGLKRSSETAHIIADGKYPVKACEDLAELEMGLWDGLTYDDIRQKYPDDHNRRSKEIAHTPPPGGESFMQGLSRFSSAVKSITDRAYENVVIVAHAGVNRIFLCDALGMDHNNVLFLPQPYGCVNSLQVKENGFILETHGVMPFPAPDEDECLYILEQHKTPLNIIDHCKAVSRKAEQIACSLDPNYRIDHGLVKSAALLHDIYRQKKYHSQAGANLLFQLGYPQVAAIIRSHHHLPEEDLTHITERTIVYYADKLIDGVEEVTLERRFSVSLDKCLTSQARASHQLKYAQALRAQALIHDCVLRATSRK